MRRICGWVILAISLALAACGSDSEDSTDTAAVTAVDAEAPEESSGGSVDACAVLASLDLAGLIAEPAGTLSDNSSEFGSFCSAPAANADSSGGISLSISNDSAASNFENQQELAGVDSEVSGLGDAAFHSGPMIIVLAGDTLVILSAVQDRDLGAGGVTDAALESAAAQVLTAID